MFSLTNVDQYKIAHAPYCNITSNEEEKTLSEIHGSGEKFDIEYNIRDSIYKYVFCLDNLTCILCYMITMAVQHASIAQCDYNAHLLY